MKKNTLTLVILLLVSFTYAKSGKVKIEGSIKNSKFDKVYIKTIADREVASADVDSKGNFKIRVSVENGFYFFKYGRETAYVYLYPKDEFTISFDAKKFDETIIYNGKGADRNNYLAKKALIDEKMTKDVNTFYKVSEAKYLENLISVKERMLSELKKYDVESFFIKDEEKSLHFDYLLGIQNYKTSYKFYLGEEIEPSSEFYRPLKKVNLENNSDYNSQPYYRYLVNSIWSKRINDEDGFENMNKKFHEIRSKDLAISQLIGFYSKITRDKKKAEDYFKLIKNNTKSEKFIKAAKEQLESMFLINKGDDSPTFTYKDINGKEVSLSNFKGKYVYIDVWATWCAPCIKQVPYLKKLEKEFSEEIVFVSISVDKKESHETWKSMVVKKELGGIHLFADNSFDSEFIEAYGISSIPRFILIDKEGKVFDDKAPYPSYEKTKPLLKSLLSK